MLGKICRVIRDIAVRWFCKTDEGSKNLVGEKGRELYGEI